MPDTEELGETLVVNEDEVESVLLTDTLTEPDELNDEVNDVDTEDDGEPDVDTLCVILSVPENEDFRESLGDTEEVVEPETLTEILSVLE